MCAPVDADAPVVAPATRGRRRDATANREALVHAAQAVLAEHPHASLDAIARAAGLSRRALYGHFPDRDSLVREVIKVGAIQFNAIAESVDDEDPRVALASLAARLWRAAAAVRASANIALDDARLADTALALEPLRRRLHGLVAGGVDSGVFRGDMTSELLASLVEETARATLREPRITTDDAASTVVRVVLSIVGLSWVEQRELLAAHPEILKE